MKVEKKDLAKSQVELTVGLSLEEFKPYIDKGVVKVSKDVKIEGFRPGKATYEVLKSKIGEMTILEEAARIAINNTISEVIEKHVSGQPVGQPKVDITKLAPDNPLEYKLVLAILPEIKLGEYRELKIKQDKINIEDKEIEKTINDLREMRVQEKIKLSEIKDGDKVIVDISMFLDNVPIEGGQDKDTGVVIGKDYIVKGFDKQLLGATKGDEREFKLNYPSDFHQQNLAGKLVEFKVKIKEVYNRELPPLDNALATSLGAKDVAGLKENIKKSIKSQKEQESKQKTELKMLEKIVDKARFGDIPELLVNHEVHNMIHELEDAVTSQGGKFDDYLAHIKKTRDQLTLDMLPEALKRVKTSLLIREIAKVEKIKVEDSEVDNHIEEMKKYYQSLRERAPKDSSQLKEAKAMNDQIKTPEYRSYVLNALTSRKVIDKLREWNVV
jgi:trigger factor